MRESWAALYKSKAGRTAACEDNVDDNSESSFASSYVARLLAIDINNSTEPASDPEEVYGSDADDAIVETLETQLTAAQAEQRKTQEEAANFVTLPANPDEPHLDDLVEFIKTEVFDISNDEADDQEPSYIQPRPHPTAPPVLDGVNPRPADTPLYIQANWDASSRRGVFMTKLC